MGLEPYEDDTGSKIGGDAEMSSAVCREYPEASIACYSDGYSNPARQEARG